MTFTTGRKKGKTNKTDMQYGKDFTVEQIKPRKQKKRSYQKISN